jgi:predicted DNA-binding protein YlxM (UPF0122 family)
MEKNIRISCLLSFYGDFLTEKQREFMQLHYDEDLTLAEIAERGGITRQGVHDALKRGEEILESCEGRLGLFEKYRSVQNSLEGLNGFLQDKKSLNAAEIEELKSKLKETAEVWEIEHGV